MPAFFNRQKSHFFSNMDRVGLMDEIGTDLVAVLSPLTTSASGLLAVVRHILGKPRASGYSIFMKRKAMLEKQGTLNILTTGTAHAANVTPEVIRGIHVAASYRLSSEIHELSLLHTTATLEKYVQAYAVGQRDGTSKGVVPELLLWILECNNTHRQLRVTIRREKQSREIYIGLWDHPYFDLPCRALFPKWTQDQWAPLLNAHAADMFASREMFDVGTDQESMVLSSCTLSDRLQRLYSPRVWMWTTFYVLVHETYLKACIAHRKVSKETFVEFWKARDALSQFFACVAFLEDRDVSLLQTANTFVSDAWHREASVIQFNDLQITSKLFSDDVMDSVKASCHAMCNIMGIVPYDMWSGKSNESVSIEFRTPRDAYAIGEGHVHLGAWRNVDRIISVAWSRALVQHARSIA